MSKNSHTKPPRTIAKGPPSWLFSNNSTNPSVPAPSNDTASAMAKKIQKPVKPAAAPIAKASSSTSAGGSQVPPTQLMDLVETFLSDQGFNNAHREFQKHRAKKGWKEHDSKKHKEKEHHSLVSVFQTWKTFSSQGTTPVLAKDDPMQKITKVSSSSSDTDSSDDSSSESESDSDGHEDVAMADAPVSEDSSSSESSSSEDSESESESDEEESKPATSASGVINATANPLKRKAESESESSSESDSDDDMSDSSSEDDRPQAKKAKTSTSSDDSSSSSDSDSSDDESSEDEDEDKVKPKATTKPQSDDDDDDSSSSSDSDSDESDSDSDAEPQVNLKEAARVPLPESGSSSESESDSDSESDDEKPQRPAKVAILNGGGSDTSVTLDKTSPEITTAAYPPLPPDPISKVNNRGKNGIKPTNGQNQPFSRIRRDVVVDPRLSSNAYVSHDYGDKAHQDLIVTKGKGFTKEKNKKKRGSYKGGPLDIHNSRSIKFED
ncbi:SRP40, C-terminal domain-containing protein [Jackrogersella minutella]|nr:SRP40, C-terminal domain-containing protein [Jackrogersella minutella]